MFNSELKQHLKEIHKFERTELVPYFQWLFRDNLMKIFSRVTFKNLLLGILLNLFASPNILPPTFQIQNIVLSSSTPSKIIFGIVYHKFDTKRLAWITIQDRNKTTGNVVNIDTKSYKDLKFLIKHHGMLVDHVDGEISSLLCDMKTGEFDKQQTAIFKANDNAPKEKFLHIRTPSTAFDFSKPSPRPKVAKIGEDYINELMHEWNTKSSFLNLDTSDVGLYDFILGGLCVWQKAIPINIIQVFNFDGVKEIFCSFPKMLQGETLLKRETYRINIRIVNGPILGQLDLPERLHEHYFASNYASLPEPENINLIQISKENGASLIKKSKFIEMACDLFFRPLNDIDLMTVFSTKYADKIISDELLKSLKISTDMDHVAAHFYGKFMKNSKVIREKFSVDPQTMKKFNLGDHLLILANHEKVIALSISKSTVDYKNLINYVVAYRNHYLFGFVISFYIIGNWPSFVKVPNIDTAPPSFSPKDYKHIFVKENIVTLPNTIATYTFSNEVGVLIDYDLGPTKIEEIVILSEMIAAKGSQQFNEESFSNWQLIDFPNPDITQHLNLCGEHCKAVLESDLDIIISRLVQMADTELQFKDSLQISMFLISYLPDIFEKVIPTSNPTEFDLVLKYKSVHQTNYQEPNPLRIRITSFDKVSKDVPSDIKHNNDKVDKEIIFYRDKSGFIDTTTADSNIQIFTC